MEWLMFFLMLLIPIVMCVFIKRTTNSLNRQIDELEKELMKRNDTMIARQFVREIVFKDKIIYVSHDKRYRYYIENGDSVLSNINAKECIEWLMDQMHDGMK